MSTKNRTRRTTTRNIRLPNQTVEQINIALSKKGPGISSLGHLKPCRRRLTSERHIHQLNDEDDIPYSSLRTGRYCKFIVGIAMGRLQFYHFPDSDRLRVGSVTD